MYLCSFFFFFFFSSRRRHTRFDCDWSSDVCSSDLCERPAMPVPVVWHPAYEVDIGAHVFPTRKYRLVRDRLLAEGTIQAADLREPAPASDEDVGLVHATAYARIINTGSLSPDAPLVLE